MFVNLVVWGFLFQSIYFLPTLNIVMNGIQQQHGKTKFCTLLNISSKISRLDHHEKVYRRSLLEGVIPKGLRLKKKACLGKTSEQFKKDWLNALEQTGLRLVSLLEVEVKRKKLELEELYRGKWLEVLDVESEEQALDWNKRLRESE